MDNLQTNQNEINNRNFDTEEIILTRNRTTSYCYTPGVGFEDDQITVEHILTVLEIQNIDHIECIQKIFQEGKPVFEITFENQESRLKSEEKLKGKIPINNTILTQTDNRKLKNNVRIPLIAVTFFEIPAELEDEKILLKMNEYGDHKKEIFHHKIRGTNILNGYRTLYFKKLNKSIPTVLWISGNKIKIKHDGQDRTPICSFCKHKGHYRDICEVLKEINEKKEHMQQEMERDKREEEQREQNAQISWAQAVEQKEKPEQKKESRKQYSEILTEKSNENTSPRKLKFQQEMRRNREKVNNLQTKKDDFSQRMEEIEQYNLQNIKKHPQKTEEQMKEEKEKKKRRKEEKKKRQNEKKLKETTTVSETDSEMEVIEKEITE